MSEEHITAAPQHAPGVWSRRNSNDEGLSQCGCGGYLRRIICRYIDAVDTHERHVVNEGSIPRHRQLWDDFALWHASSPVSKGGRHNESPLLPNAHAEQANFPCLAHDRHMTSQPRQWCHTACTPSVGLAARSGLNAHRKHGAWVYWSNMVHGCIGHISPSGPVSALGSKQSK